MRRSDAVEWVRSFQRQTAEDLMDAVAFFEKETKCDILLRAMLDGHFGGVPIVDEKRQLIGMVNRESLFGALVSGEDLFRLRAIEIMRPTYAVSIHCPAIKVRMMRQNGLRQAPVVDEKHRPVGVVTLGRPL